MKSNFTHMWGILGSVWLVNSKHTYFFCLMSPLKTQPKQYISFVFYCINNNKLKVSQQHVSSQFSLESTFSDLVLELVDFQR